MSIEWSLKAIRLDEKRHGTQRKCDLAPSPEDLRPSDDEEEQEEGGKGRGDAEPKGQLFLY